MEKNFKKRTAILSFLRQTKEHPSAEMVFNHLKPEILDLSLGTVYRNLTLFREQGMVRGVGVVDGHERFDANTADHPHFVCKHCHAVIDIPGIEDDGQVERKVSQTYGFTADHHDLTVYGTCGKCTLGDYRV